MDLAKYYYVYILAINQNSSRPMPGACHSFSFDKHMLMVREKGAAMEITVIDDSDYVGWLASATRIGEIYMTDVKSMVTNVIGALGPTGRMDRPNILDHGNDTEIEIGCDVVDVSSFSKFEPFFLLLRGKFAPSGFVHLQHCQIGQNHALMTLFARTFNVPVYAGTGNHNPLYRVKFGDYEMCNADAICSSDVSRP